MFGTIELVFESSELVFESIEHRFFTRVRTISYRTKNNLYSIKVITHGYRGCRGVTFSCINDQLAKEKSKYFLLITVFFCNFAAK